MNYDLGRDKALGVVSATCHQYEQELEYTSADLLRYRTKRQKKVEGKKETTKMPFWKCT